MTGFESVQAIVPHPPAVESGSRDVSGGRDKDHATATPEVRVLVAAYSADAMGSSGTS